MADMVTKASARPKKGAGKRKAHQKSVREKRDVDIMNVRLPWPRDAAASLSISGLTWHLDER